jgi:dynein intermediate chain 1
LKNPSFPEFVIPSPYGIMCLEVHSTKNFLTAVGMYDGSVAIFNVKENLNGPIFMTSMETRHTDPVWSVKWLEADEEGRLRFCSISTDGQVIFCGVTKLKKN